MNLKEYLQLMDNFIAESKNQGATTPDLLMGQLNARWNLDKPAPLPHPELDHDGRYLRKRDGKPVFTPAPLLEKWPGLTELQIQNIRSNCSVDGDGRYKWNTPQGIHYEPAAFTGFDANGGVDFRTGGDIMVSGFNAERWELVKQHDGSFRPHSVGYFPEFTYKTRLPTIEAVEAYDLVDM